MKLSTRPEKRVGTDAMWDHAEAAMAAVLELIERAGGGRIKTGDQPGRGRLLRPEIRVRPARRHRARLAVRHHPGRLQPAGPLRRLLHRPGRAEEDARDGPPGDLRLHGALHRHPHRELRRAFPALARAGAGRGRTITSEARRLRAARSSRRRAGRGCGSRRTCATRRSTTRCASTRSPRCRCSSWSAARRRRSAPSRSAASAAPSSAPWALDAALRALADEAVPPDLRREGAAEIGTVEPEPDLTLDGHHVVERTVA